MDSFNLRGRVALVTGGNGGIGLGMARALAVAGARVVIAGRDEGRNARALAELSALGEAEAVTADLEREEDCRGLPGLAVARFGRLDVLVNNAGINVRRPPEDLPLADWRRVLEVNLTAAFLCAQAAHPALCAAGGGKVISVGSMMSIFGAPFAVAYAASKGGVVQMTRALATAWAHDNVQVNAVLPGWIDTDLTRAARGEVEGLEGRVTARTPAGRWGTPADLGGVAVFLASRASDFVTGTAIPVDGGYSVQGV